MFPHHANSSGQHLKGVSRFPPLPVFADHPKSLIVTCDPLGTVTPGRRVKALAGPGKLAWAGQGPGHAKALLRVSPRDEIMGRTGLARPHRPGSGHEIRVIASSSYTILYIMLNSSNLFSKI